MSYRNAFTDETHQPNVWLEHEGKTTKTKRFKGLFDRQRNTTHKPKHSKAIENRYATTRETSLGGGQCSHTSSEQHHPENDNAIIDLHQLVGDGDITKLKTALDKLYKAAAAKRKAQINKRDAYKRTPLHYAAINKNAEICELLVDKGADIRIPDEDGRTALHLVLNEVEPVEFDLETSDADSEQNRKAMDTVISKIVTNLLKQEATSDEKGSMKDKDGSTPLHIASRYGYLECVILLITKRPKWMQEVDTCKRTPLHLAAEYGHVDVAKEFFKIEKTTVETQNQPLRERLWNSREGKQSRPSYVKEMLAMQDEDGCTPMHYAVTKQNVDMCQLLLNNGANTVVKNRDGKTALHVALNQEVKLDSNSESSATTIGDEREAKDKAICEIVTLLLDKKIQPGVHGVIQDKDGCLPLHYASLHGYVECAKLLIKDQTSLVQSARGFNQLRILSLKDMMNTKDEDGCTPLHYAVKYRHIDMCNLLLKNEADIYIGNGDGKTALHLALDKQEGEGHKEMDDAIKKILDLLLEHSSGWKVRDKDGCTPLHYAARCGYLKCAKSLIEKNSGQTNAPDHRGIAPTYEDVGNVEAVYEEVGESSKPAPLAKAVMRMKDKDGCTPLHYAVRIQHKEMCQELLENEAVYLPDFDKGVDSIKDNQGCTPLHYASRIGDKDCTKLLIEHNSDLIDITDNRGRTPLHTAVESGHDKVASILMKRGAHVRYKDKNNRTPLHLAAAAGNEEITDLILEKIEKKLGARVVDSLDDKDNDGNTSLHLAVDNGHLFVAERIVKHCPEKHLSKVLNAQRKNRETPLHLAARYGHIDIVEFLIAKGAKVNECDKTSSTPLMLASQFNRHEVAKHLLNKCGAQHGLSDSDGIRALHVAADKGHGNTMKVLLEKTKPNKSEYDSNTPLHAASKEGHYDAVKMLLKKQAKVDCTNEYGQNPFHLAAENGHLKIVKEIYESQHQVIQTTDKNENTPLHLAALAGKIEVVQELVNLGAKVWARNAEKLTPLDCCAKAGMHKSAEALLAVGCPADPQDKELTPLHLACQWGHTEMVRVLLRWKADVTHLSENGWNALDFAIDSGNASCARVIIEDEKWKEALKNKTEDGKTPMRKLIKKMPEIAEEVLNKCMTENEKPRDDENYELSFDYELLDDEFYSKGWQKEKENKKQEQDKVHVVKDAFNYSLKPSLVKNHHPLNMMVENKRKTLLRHPVVISLLNYKWRTYGMAVYSFNLLFYLLFMVFFNSYMLTMPPPYSVLDRSSNNTEWINTVRNTRDINNTDWTTTNWNNTDWNTTDSSTADWNTTDPTTTDWNITGWNTTGWITTGWTTPDWNSPTSASCVALIAEAQPPFGPCYDYNSWGIIAKPFIILLSVISLIKELYQLVSQMASYFQSLTNLLEVSLYVLAIFTVYSDTNSAGYYGIREDWQWQIGAVSIFLSWMVLIMFIRNVPTFGIYVLMFTEILRTFMKFFFVFILFILGFAFSFHCLLQNQYAFRQWWDAVLRTSLMMLGEIGFEDIFLTGEEAIDTGADDHTIIVSAVNYPAVSYILFVLSLIILSIIIMNLLVGLAVDDIQSIQENAKLTRCTMQVKLFLDVEYKLPSFIRHRVIRKERKLFPNKHSKRSFFIRWFNSEDNLNSSTIGSFLEENKSLELEQQAESPDRCVESLVGKVESLVEKANYLDDKKSLEEKVESLGEKANSVGEKVESLQGQAKSLDRRVASLDGKVESMDGRVKSLDGKVESLDSKVESMDGKVESLDGKVESLDEKVESLKSMMSAILSHFNIGEKDKSETSLVTI